MNDTSKINKAPEVKHEEKGKRNSKVRKHQNVVNNFFNYQLYRDLPEYHQLHQKHPPHRVKRGSFGKNSKKHFLAHGMSFINLNYKFIVDGRKQYQAQQLDPNVPVDTGDIIQIIVPKGPSCPICLTKDLVAPRMITSCGHMLCLTCLLSLLSNEVPVHMKRESKAIVEKYNDCPLCGSIIRKSNVKPVKIMDVDERFEVPRIGEDVVLTLMNRNTRGIVPLPRSMEGSDLNSLPWVNLPHDFSQYLRFFKADMAYILAMYELEKNDIQAAYKLDRELYMDDGKYVEMAMQAIGDELDAWSSSFSEDNPEPDSTPVQLAGQTFYFYQTGFKASTTYILSPLDMKVLKTSYNDSYEQLPDSLVAKVENIRFEELDAGTATSKLKYLSHLPHGTLVGFLECSWEANDFLSTDAWKQFEPELKRRSNATSRKLKREENDRLRAMADSERRAREFIERENNRIPGPDIHGEWNPGMMGSLSISDFRELPTLSASPGPSLAAPLTKKSIWGTAVPKSSEDDDSEATEMIRKAREEIERQQAENSKKGKKKKKYVLLSI